MSRYLFGVLIGFVEPVLHGWANILDNYFSNTVFPKLSVLLFFGTVLNVVFLPIILFFNPPHLLSYPLLAVVAVIAVIDIAYLFPYYWALRHTDTSIVAALFSLGKIFVPVLAYFVLGETLAPVQYLGFALIVCSAIFLTLDMKKFTLNKAVFLMTGVSLALSVQAILYKYVFDAGVSWGSVVTALTLMEVVIAAIVMFSANKLADIIEDFKTIRANMKIFVAQQVLEWGGNVSSSYAVSVLPVTIAQGIASTQPLFVLVYAAIFGRNFATFFKEATHRKEMARKSFFFALTIAGTILVVAYGSNIDI